jgi:hypothetical protein
MYLSRKELSEKYQPYSINESKSLFSTGMGTWKGAQDRLEMIPL